MELMIEKQREHIGALDGLRGVAAFAVLINHGARAYRDVHNIAVDQSMFWTTLDHWGHNSVIIFFCLSGFVLQWSMTGAWKAYGQYGIRRVARLYPALFVAITCAIVLRLLIGAPVDVGTAVKHYTLYGVTLADIDYISPIWSLVYEARFSVVFPLMAIACTRWPKAFLAGCILTYALASILGTSRGIVYPFFVGFGHFNSLILTAIFLPIFGLGMSLAGSKEVSGWRVSRKAAIPILIACIAVYCFGRDQLLVAIAGIGFISCAASPGIFNAALGRSAVQFLGRISYSLYLIHTPFLALTIWMIGSVVPFPIVLLIFALGSMAIAWIMYRLVELPCHAWGKRITNPSRTLTA